MISLWKPAAPRKKVQEQRLGQRFLGPLSMGAGHRIAMQAIVGCPALSPRSISVRLIAITVIGPKLPHQNRGE